MDVSCYLLCPGW